MTPWYKQKTLWTALLGMFTASGSYAMGEITLGDLIAALFAGFSVIFLRQGVAKAAPPVILALFLFSGCGLLSSGTSGLAGEAGAATATGNFYVFNLDGPATVAIDEEGKVVVKSTSNGGEAETLGAGIILNVGREAISAKTSSGGGGTGASQAGGSGDVSPSLVLPGVP